MEGGKGGRAREGADVGTPTNLASLDGAARHGVLVRPRHLSFAFIVLTVVLLVMPPPAAEGQTGASITIAPTAIAIGGSSSITVRGSGFPAGDLVTVYSLSARRFDQGVAQDLGRLGTVMADQRGAFTTTVVLPVIDRILYDRVAPDLPLYIMAYGASFGPMTRPALDATPKATLAVIDAADGDNPLTGPRLPVTGTGSVGDADAVEGLLLLIGAVVATAWTTYALRSRAAHCCPRARNEPGSAEPPSKG